MSRKNSTRYIRYLPIYGSISTGIIYLGIGVIAILSFLKIKEGGADESSLLAYLNNYMVGKVFIWIILLGTVSYIIWRFYEAIQDPYGYGKKRDGMVKRIGIALSTVADALIAYSAMQVLLGISSAQADGSPEEERMMVSNLFQESWGRWLVMFVGSVVLMAAVLQFLYGITRGYKERLNITQFGPTKKKVIHIFAWVGYLARGIIVGIIGFFLIKAAILKDAQHVVNTDKAFDFIGDHIGHLCFILVALGTICYAFFMFLLGATYDSDKD
ncbi:MAG TPA: DUF1206 domain-containing protein [Chryseolinea sp.]|nr:DUF1206 domain-containing protein [Chryseolinea sp.]